MQYPEIRRERAYNAGDATMATGFRAWAAGWKFACVTIASVSVATPVSHAAQSIADQQVQAVFGVPPWDEYAGEPSGGLMNQGGVRNCGIPFGSDLSATGVIAASEQCIKRGFGLTGPFFRSDLGLDSTGSAPPAGGNNSKSGGLRCTGPVRLNGATQYLMVCELWASPHQIVAPVAQDQYIKTTPGQPISINLAKGYIGALPTSAALAVYTPIGGTVTGLPNTTVTFTPFSLSYEGVATFAYQLNSAAGVSNVATVHVTVAPNVISPQEQAQLAQLGQWLGEAAKVAGIASVGTDPKNYVLKQAALTIGIELSQQAFVDVTFKNHGLQGQKADLLIDTAKFIQGNVNVTPSNPLSAFLSVLSASLKLGSLVANWKANDPPDSNYTAVAQPPQLGLPSTGNSVVDKVIIDYLTFYSYTIASIQAAERYQGASIAGQPAWAATQQNAYQQFSAEAATAHSLLAADNQKLVQALPAAAIDLSGFPGGAAGLVAAYHAQCSQPLPAAQNLKLLALVNQFQALGAQATIDQTVCDYADGITEADVNLNLTQLLSAPLP